MPRRKDESLLDEIHDLFKLTPTWVGPVIAAVAFLLLRFVVPWLIPRAPSGPVDPALLWRPLLAAMSWVALAAILLAWIMAEVWKRLNRRLLDRQNGIETVRNLSWQQFERLVSEAFRRQGYVSEVVGSNSGDGGVDIRLTRAGEKLLVQCKHWKAFKVGVTAVRELLGVVVSEKATSGIVVTSGRFTDEATRFAEANPQIRLVAATELLRMIDDVRGIDQPAATVAPTLNIPTIRLCPACGADMQLRTARKGPDPGSQFWGCPRYPQCRGTRPHT